MRTSFRMLAGACAALAICLSAGVSHAEEAKPVAKRVPAVPMKKVAAAPAKKAEAGKAKPITSKDAKRPTTAVYSGKVVDAEGNPVAGATVTNYAYIYVPRGAAAEKEGAKPELRAQRKVVSGEDGSFKLTLPPARGANMPLYVFDDKGNGAILNADKTGAADMTIKLAPQRKTVLNFETWDKEKTKTLQSSVYVYTLKEDGKRGERFFYTPGSEGKAEFTLPVGKYYLWIRGRGCANKTMNLEIKAGTDTFMPEPIKLEPTIIASHMGKAAPKISPTAVRKLGTKIEEGKGLSLDDYKGKWLIVEFWGIW